MIRRMKDAQWWLEPVPRIYVAVLFSCFCVAAGAAAWAIYGQAHRTSAVAQRTTRDEHDSCIIQARGLPAGHDLATSMQDIGALLAASSPAQERARGVPAATITLLTSLRRNSNAYAAIEAKQPASRSC